MARYEHLAIYRTAYDLLSLIEKYVQNMPRPTKPVLGMRMHTLCEKISKQVTRANSAADPDKIPFLRRLLERQAELELLLRLCKDKQYISIPQYARAIELTASVGKQANGWIRYASPAT